MTFSMGINDEIKIENFNENAEDNYSSNDNNSFTGSSKDQGGNFDNSFQNFSTEEDSLRLDKRLHNNTNINSTVQSNHSAVNIMDTIEESLLQKKIANEFESKVFSCQSCTKVRNKVMCTNNTKIDHTFKKSQSFRGKKKLKFQVYVEENYPCRYCPLISKSSQLYLIHLVTHGNNVQKCNFCPRKCRVKEFLKPLTCFNVFLCEFCGKTLYKKNAYIAHVSSHYQKQCKTCNKMFPKYEILTAHLKVCREKI